VYPPVAFVDTAGTHTTGASPKGRYLIQYIGDEGIYDLHVFRQNVYIPAVFAVRTGTDPEMDGKISSAYEDLGVDATGLKYKAKYAVWNQTLLDALTLASDSDYTYAAVTDFAYYNKDKSSDGSREAVRKEWEAFADEKEFKNPVSSNPEAWIINNRTAQETDDDGDSFYTATYRANLGAPSGAVVSRETVKIEKFYRVDRLRYVSGIEKVPTIAADDPKYAGTDDGTLENWWKLLRDADLKFEVIYYRLPGDEAATPKREISMADYVRAMYLPDESTPPKPRASLPILSGWATNPTLSGVRHSVLNDYSLSLSLFYYSPVITGTIGKGKVAANDYLNANAATIPITDSGLIATFTGFTKERIDITAHESEKGGEPVITAAVTGITEAQQRASLYEQLQKYYKVNWTYEDPRDASKPVYLKVDWPDSDRAITDYDFTDIEAEETRQCSVTFPSPASSPGDDDEVEFDFIVKP